MIKHNKVNEFTMTQEEQRAYLVSALQLLYIADRSYSSDLALDGSIDDIIDMLQELVNDYSLEKLSK